VTSVAITACTLLITAVFPRYQLLPYYSTDSSCVYVCVVVCWSGTGATTFNRVLRNTVFTSQGLTSPLAIANTRVLDQSIDYWTCLNKYCSSYARKRLSERLRRVGSCMCQSGVVWGLLPCWWLPDVNTCYWTSFSVLAVFESALSWMIERRVTDR